MGLYFAKEIEQNNTQMAEEDKQMDIDQIDEELNALLLFLQVFEQTNTRHNFQINYTMAYQTFAFAILSVRSKQQQRINTVDIFLWP